MLDYQKKWREKNIERVKEQDAIYYKENREKILQQQREYYKNNKDKIKKRKEKNKEARALYEKDWRNNNPEKMKEYQKKFYEKHKEEVRKEHSIYYKNNKKSHSIRARRNHLKSKYGLTLEQYEKLLEESENKCAICEKSFDSCSPCIDHCHSSGLVRGLLCRKCNLNLHTIENKQYLRKALEYLRVNEVEDKEPL